jgi:hypothetical protein
MKVYIDIDSLIRNRLLIQANSGRGKSWLLRRAAEQLSGKIQVIIIDSEGEFASLREAYPYVLAGKGGETAADPRTAGLLAHRLLELHASAVLDIYEMKPDARHLFVKNFLDAMVDSPKHLWHPVVVLLDEAHVFCPEKGQGESVATESVINMASRGRKRGFALVVATQRLGKLSKNCSAEMLNVLIGGTFQDIDRKRAAETLGIYGKETHDFFDAVKMLKPGTFYGLGPAISEDLVVMQCGPIETTHPEAGAGRHASPPATPENVAKFLPKLSDLPAEQEQKEKTVKELNEQIRDLRRQLKAVPAPAPTVVSAAKISKEEIRLAIQAEVAPYKRELRDQRKQLKDLTEFSKKIGEKLRDAYKSIEDFTKGIVLSEFNPPDLDLKGLRDGLQRRTPNVPVAPTPVRPVVAHHSAPTPAPTIEGLKEPEMKVLRALIELQGADYQRPHRKQLAAWSGYTVNGHFNNTLGKLNGLGLVRYPGGGAVEITDAGAALVGDAGVPDIDEIRSRVMQRLDDPARKLMAVMLAEPKGTLLTSETLAERSGYTVNGHFNNTRGSLATQGLLEYMGKGTVKAADWLFES